MVPKLTYIVPKYNKTFIFGKGVVGNISVLNVRTLRTFKFAPPPTNSALSLRAKRSFFLARKNRQKRHRTVSPVRLQLCLGVRAGVTSGTPSTSETAPDQPRPQQREKQGSAERRRTEAPEMAFPAPRVSADVKSDTMSEASETGTANSGWTSGWDSREELRDLVTRIGLKDVADLHQDRFRVDRKRLEQMLSGEGRRWTTCFFKSTFFRRQRGAAARGRLLRADHGRHRHLHQLA